MGGLDCLTSRQGARWLNGHSWNFTCFLTQYCDKSFPYMFVFNLHCHSQVFPRQRVCCCRYHCSADRALVIYSCCALLLFRKHLSLNKFCGQADSGSKALLLHTSLCVCIRYSLQSTQPLQLFFPCTLFLMHSSPPVLPSPSQAFVPLFLEKRNHHSHLELKRYFCNAGMFTLFIARSHHANHGDAGGSKGKPKHSAYVTGILFHR